MDLHTSVPFAFNFLIIVIFFTIYYPYHPIPFPPVTISRIAERKKIDHFLPYLALGFLAKKPIFFLGLTGGGHELPDGLKNNPELAIVFFLHVLNLQL